MSAGEAPIKQAVKWIDEQLHDNPKARIIDKVVTQSSDREFHCLSITIFYDLLQS